MDISAVILADQVQGIAIAQEDSQSMLVRMLAGKPLILWIRDSLRAAGARDQLYVMAPDHRAIRDTIGECAAFSFYDEEAGESAIMQASNFIESRSGITIVMPANLPLLDQDILTEALSEFQERGLDAMILKAEQDSRRPLEVNGEVFLFNTARLLSAIGKMGMTKQGLKNIKTLLDLMMEDGLRIGHKFVSPELLLPIETLLDSNIAKHVLNGRIIRKHVAGGVEFMDSEQTFVQETVKIGRGTVVWPGAVLTGDTSIGEDAVIGAHTVIEDAQIGNKAKIRQSVIRNSHIGDRCQVGPYANLYDGAWLDRDVTVGSGADISNAVIGYGVVLDAKVLIRDAEIGDSARIGAGAITVNEDLSGHSFRTIIGSLAMVGSNASLVAPVEVEANSYVAAGSVITGNVPAFALALGRSRQTVLEDWVRHGAAKREPV